MRKHGFRLRTVYCRGSIRRIYIYLYIKQECTTYVCVLICQSILSYVNVAGIIMVLWVEAVLIVVTCHFDRHLMTEEQCVLVCTSVCRPS